MKRFLHTIFILLFLCPGAAAYEFAELRTETAEELLLFFEEEELVAATRHAIPVRKAPAIATVITAEEIRDMGARNLMDVLKMVPGFGVSISEGNSTMLEVRGIRTLLSEKVLVMIDGHSLNRNFTGTAIRFHFNDLPVEHIRRIEIIRGPGSALYGSNAFAAVINIITRDAGEIDGLEVKASYGSFDSKKINLTGGNSFGNGIRLSGSFDHYQTHGAELTVREDSLTGTPWSLAPGPTDSRKEKTDIFLKAAYRDFTYRGHYMTKKAGMYIGLGYALVESNPFGVDNYWHELSWHRELREDLTSDIKVFFDHFEQGGTIELFPDGYLGMFPDGLIGGPFLKNDTYGVEVQANYDLIKDHHIVGGAHYEKMKQYDVRRVANYLPAPNFTALASVQETSPDVNWNRNASREIWAVYVQDEWEIRDNLNLTAGVRYDHYSEFGGTTNPRAGLVWSFHPKFDLKLLYGQAFRAPNFGELYTDSNIASMGNPDLKPETIKTYEAALGFKPAEHIYINLNYFFNKIEDQIRVDTTTSPAFFVNGGKTEADGIEVVLRGQYSPHNYWKVSYTYQDPEDPETDQRLPDVPLHRATASINYGLSKYINMHTDILWTGERSRQAGDTRGPVADYITVDLALTLKNFYRRLELQGVVHNLFDEKYEDPDRSRASQFVPYDFPRAGISATLNATYKF